MIEKFSIGDRFFEAEIKEFEYDSEKDPFSGKYQIKVKDDKKVIALLKPSHRDLNTNKKQHKILFVERSYRELGLANWLLDKSEELNDLIPTECFTAGLGLEKIYLKKGYKILRTVWDEVNNVDCVLMKLDPNNL